MVMLVRVIVSVTLPGTLSVAARVRDQLADKYLRASVVRGADLVGRDLEASIAEYLNLDLIGALLRYDLCHVIVLPVRPS